MRKLSLNEVHKSLGANFFDSSGWSVPKDYGNETSEYSTVRNGVGIIDLSSRGKLLLSGKDHLKFLQGMLSNDVMKLEEGKGMYATVLTVKGRMISDMRVYKENDSIILDLEPGINEKVLELLTKFRLSYKANIEDVSETQGLLSIQGPKAHELLEMLVDEKLPEFEEYDFINKELLGYKIKIVYVNRTGEEGYDIYISNDGLKLLWDTLLEKGGKFDIKPLGYSALNTLRIEGGIPVYNVDMDESNIPIEAGLWSALDFEKGCYVGQEVVARIKWRGHVNWHLVGFQIDGDENADIGDEIVDGERKIGRITSSAYSEALNKPLSLGYIRREFNNPGTRVSLKKGDGIIQNATVFELPFYKGSFKLTENVDNN